MDRLKGRTRIVRVWIHLPAPAISGSVTLVDKKRLVRQILGRFALPGANKIANDRTNRMYVIKYRSKRYRA